MSVAGDSPGPSLQAHVEEEDSSTVERPLLCSPLLPAYLPPQLMCLVTKPLLLSTALTACPS